MLRTWFHGNKSEGLKFIQFIKNVTFHYGINFSHHEDMIGSTPKIGLNNCILPTRVVAKLKTEKNLEKALNTIEEKKNKGIKRIK